MSIHIREQADRLAFPEPSPAPDVDDGSHEFLWDGLTRLINLGFTDKQIKLILDIKRQWRTRCR